jgi:hypothetical protein
MARATTCVRYRSRPGCSRHVRGVYISHGGSTHAWQHREDHRPSHGLPTAVAPPNRLSRGMHRDGRHGLQRQASLQQSLRKRRFGHRGAAIDPVSDRQLSGHGEDAARAGDHDTVRQHQTIPLIGTDALHRHHPTDRAASRPIGNVSRPVDDERLSNPASNTDPRSRQRHTNNVTHGNGSQPSVYRKRGDVLLSTA